MDIFLSKFQIQQMKILKRLAQQPISPSLDDISNYTGLSKRSTINALETLNHHINTVFTDSQVQLNISKHEIYLTLPDKINQIYIIEKMNLYYLKNAIRFNIIEHLLKRDYPSAEALADELFISTASLYRYLAEIKPLLQGHQIKIAFDIETTSLRILGTEKHIRAFYFYFYWNSFKNLEWPFTAELKLPLDKSIYNIQHPSTAKIVKMDYLITIAKHRIEQAAFLSPSTTMKQIAACYGTFKNIDLLMTNFLAISLDHPNYQSERAGIILSQRLISNGTDSQNEQIDIAHLLKNLDNKVTAFTLFSINFLMDSLQVNMKQTEQYLQFYHLVLFNICAYYYEIDVSEFFTSSFKKVHHYPYHEDKEIIAATEQLFERFEAANPFKDLFSNELIQGSFYYTFYLLTLDSAKKHVRIYVQNARNYLNETMFKNKLQQLFSDNLVIVDSIDERTDIIITDTFETSNIQTFFIDQLTDQKNWDALCLTIHQKIMAQHFM